MVIRMNDLKDKHFVHIDECYLDKYLLQKVIKSI